MIPFQIHLFAAFYMAIVSSQYPGICRIEKKRVFRFLLMMVYVTLFRLVFHKLSGTPALPNDPSSPMNRINFLTILGVFWEDALFTLPIIVADKMNASKFLKGAMMVVSSIAFASGHIDYSLGWAFITLFYVPLISYKYGKKYGLGTVMVCHILYDAITLMTVKIMARL